VKKIALTGNIGCGKSTVANMFRELGAYTFDADKIIHSFYQKGHPVRDEVVRIFGEGILDEEGNIDRKKLAQVVFGDENSLRKLEEITHKALYEYLGREFSRLPEDSIAVVEASLLIEKGTYKNSIEKGFTEEDFERRWRKQMPIEEKVKFADFVIDNSGSIEDTKRQVEEVFKRIKEDT